MRLARLALLFTLACGSSDDFQAANGVLETNATSYVATPMTSGEHTDTLQLRAPWQRSFNGQPIGAVDGEFYVVYETRICRSVSTTGACSPINRLEYVRSNKFRITTP